MTLTDGNFEEEVKDSDAIWFVEVRSECLCGALLCVPHASCSCYRVLLTYLTATFPALPIPLLLLPPAHVPLPVSRPFPLLFCPPPPHTRSVLCPLVWSLQGSQASLD